MLDSANVLSANPWQRTHQHVYSLQLPQKRWEVIHPIKIQCGAICLPPSSPQLFVASDQDVWQIYNVPCIAALDDGHLCADQETFKAHTGGEHAQEGLTQTGKPSLHF